MVRFTIISGAISLSLFVLSALFKLMHWAGASWLLVISMVVFALVFIPTLAIYLIRKSRTKGS